MSNKALDILHRDVSKDNINYILTFRLNRDILENFFGAMRSKGGLNDHPSPKDFKCRIRKYIMARNTEILNGKRSVENSEIRDLNMRRKEQNIKPGETKLKKKLIKSSTLKMQSSPGLVKTWKKFNSVCLGIPLQWCLIIVHKLCFGTPNKNNRTIYDRKFVYSSYMCTSTFSTSISSKAISQT